MRLDSRHSVNERFHEGVFDWLCFRGRTMRLVNQRLDDLEMAVSDQTIAGICDLVLLEVSLRFDFGI